MGIRGLKTFLMNRAKTGIRHHASVREFVVAENVRLGAQNFIVGIDASNFLIKYIAHADRTEPAFFKQIISSITAGMYPIFIFDGKAPLAKGATIKKRQKKMEKNKQQFNELRSKIQNYEMSLYIEESKEPNPVSFDSSSWESNDDWDTVSVVPVQSDLSDSSTDTDEVMIVPDSMDIDHMSERICSKPIQIVPHDNISLTQINNSEEYKLLKTELEKCRKRTRKFDQTDIDNLKAFLDFVKIPHITAPEESDNLMAELYKEKIIDFCLTDDSDMLPKGCGNVIQITSSKDTGFGKNGPSVTQYILEDILIELEMTFHQFVDFCIILGCDYFEDIVLSDDPQTTYEIFMKYPSIEQYVKEYRSNASAYMEQIVNSRKEFMDFNINLNGMKRIRRDNTNYYFKFSIDKIIDYFVTHGIIYDKNYMKSCEKLTYNANKNLKYDWIFSIYDG